MPDDALEIIDTITVWPISMFKDEGSAKPDKGQSITLRVKS